MKWSRVVGAFGGLILAGSAFLTWFTRADRDFSANQIPALILFRYVRTAPGFRLGYLALGLGGLILLATAFPAPTRGWLLLSCSGVALAGTVAFAAQLLREVAAPGVAGGLLDYLGFGAFVAAIGALLGLVAAVGAFERPVVRFPTRRDSQETWGRFVGGETRSPALDDSPAAWAPAEVQPATGDDAGQPWNPGDPTRIETAVRVGADPRPSPGPAPRPPYRQPPEFPTRADDAAPATGRRRSDPWSEGEPAPVPRPASHGAPSPAEWVPGPDPWSDETPQPPPSSGQGWVDSGETPIVEGAAAGSHEPAAFPTCPACGFDVAPESRFCTNCGAHLPGA